MTKRRDFTDLLIDLFPKKERKVLRKVKKVSSVVVEFFNDDGNYDRRSGQDQVSAPRTHEGRQPLSGEPDEILDKDGQVIYRRKSE